MKSLFATILFVAAVATAASAQTASTICLEEAKTAFATIDQVALIQSDSVTQIEYNLHAKFRAPGVEPLRASESFVLAKGISLYKGYDGWIYTDATEGFYYRPQQFVLYRVKSSLGKKNVVEGMDAGLLNYCTVTYCGFYRAEIAEERAWKEREMTVNEEGQKKYNISHVRFVNDPLNGSLKLIKVTYTGNSVWTEAEYRFTSIGYIRPEGGVKAPKDHFLKPDGTLLDMFNGCKLQDIRR